MKNGGFSAPVEYFGQGTSTVIGLKSSTEPRLRGKTDCYRRTRRHRWPVTWRARGSAPALCTTSLRMANLSLVLGSVNTVDTDVVVLLGLRHQHSAASAPEVTLSGESIQTGGTASSTVTLPGDSVIAAT